MFRRTSLSATTRERGGQHNRVTEGLLATVRRFLLYLADEGFCDCGERLGDIDACFCARFEIRRIDRLGKSASLLGADGPFCGEVAFVSDGEDLGFVASLLTERRNLLGCPRERFGLENAKDDDSRLRAAIEEVGRSKRSR
jgi:hypothetical protein